MKIKSIHSSLPLASAIALLLAAPTAHAQSWSGGSSGAWLSTGNWTGAVAAGSPTVISDTDIAVFSASPFASAIGINMNTTLGVYYLGAIDNTNATIRNIGNSSTSTAGVLTLNGATVNSVANTIIRNNTSTLLNIQAIQGSGLAMGLALGNSTNNIVTIDGAGRVLIASNITESASGNKLTKDGIGIGPLVLGGTNTYTGGTQVNTGTLSFRITAARPSTGTHTFAAGTALGLGFGGVTQYTAAEIQQAFGLTSGYTGNLANISIGDTNNISIDTTGAAAVLSANIGPSVRGLEKIDQGANLTLTGANQYSGRTVVNGGGAILVQNLGNVGDASSNVGTNSTIDLMTGSFLQFSNTTPISSDKTLNIAGTSTVLSAAGTVGNTVTLSADISPTSVSNKTLTIQGANVGSNTISGIISNGAGGVLSLNKNNAGSWILSNANTFSGTTVVTTGTLTLSNSLALQNSPLNTTSSVAGGTAVGLKTTVTTLTLGGLTGAKNFAASGGVFTTTAGGYDAVTALTLNPGTGATPSYSAVIANGAPNMTLTKSGTGTQTLTGVNTYTGPTSITGGMLSIDGTGSINTSSGVTVTASTLRYNSSTALSAPVTFTNGTVAGTNWTGSLAGLTIDSNKTISPGNSPGAAQTTAQTWATGGSYRWEINNATGAAGADPGWDLVNGTGILDITSAMGSEFNLVVTSLTTLNAAGLATNFADLTNYNWLIADFNSINGFAANAFNINTSQFANPFTGTFAVSLGGVGMVPGDNSQIYLTYNAIPEPAAALLGGLGLLVLLRRRRA